MLRECLKQIQCAKKIDVVKFWLVFMRHSGQCRQMNDVVKMSALQLFGDVFRIHEVRGQVVNLVAARMRGGTRRVEVGCRAAVAPPVAAASRAWIHTGL